MKPVIKYLFLLIIVFSVAACATSKKKNGKLKKGKPIPCPMKDC